MDLQIRALIFDLDGVITDTAEFHFLAWSRMAQEEGYPFTREDNEALRGVSRRESLLRLLKGRIIPEEKMFDLMERKNNYYVELLDTITPSHLLPGVADFLANARDAGLKLGIGSASKNARAVLVRLGVIDQFDALGDGYSVVNTKPAPDLFIWTAGRLGVYPPQAVVFEDAEAGIDAAKKGGFWTVGMSGGTHDGRERVREATIILPDLIGLTVAALIDDLSSAAGS
jgi:beta-phosphoglucomutase